MVSEFEGEGSEKLECVDDVGDEDEEDEQHQKLRQGGHGERGRFYDAFTMIEYLRAPSIFTV